jgi:hypothetical protein
VEDWFGYTQEQFRGHNALALAHPDDIPTAVAAFTDAMQRSAADGGAAASVHVTRRMRSADGSYMLVHTSGCMEGPRWHLVCKRLNAQEAKEKAIRGLLLSISHELRTPAQSGLAATELLAARASVQGDAEAAFLVQAVGASCGLLLGMVSNATSMRSIEKGELDMHPSLFDPAEALASLLQVCRLGCTAAAARIDWAQAEPLPQTVLADRTFFSQILQNLVRACVANARQNWGNPHSCIASGAPSVAHRATGDQRGALRGWPRRGHHAQLQRGRATAARLLQQRAQRCSGTWRAGAVPHAARLRRGPRPRPLRRGVRARV